MESRRMISIVTFCILLSTLMQVAFAYDCVNNASFNETTQSCQCNPSYKGIGDLCCFKTRIYDTCTLGGDPILTSYDGTKANINFPCLSSIAKVIGKTEIGSKRCVVNVYNTGDVVDNGAIYTKRVVVSFKIGGKDEKIFKIFDDKIQRPGDATPSLGNQLYRRNLNVKFIFGEKVTISYSRPRLLWTINACNTKIVFRAVQDDKALQEKTAGVCVMIRKNRDTYPQGSIGAGDVCSLTPALQSTLPIPYRLLSGFIKQHGDMANSLKRQYPDYRTSCNVLANIAKNVCNKQLFHPVKKCAPLLYHGSIRLCLKLSGVTGPQIVEMVAQCFRFQCRSTRRACAAYARSLPAIARCMPSFCINNRA